MDIQIRTLASEENLLNGRKWHWRKFGSLQYWWIVAGTVFILTGIAAISFNFRYPVACYGER